MLLPVGSVRYEPASQLTLGGYFIPEYNCLQLLETHRVPYWIVSSKTGMNLNDRAIENNGITFGVGLPVAGFSNVNMGFEIGKLGAGGESLIENYVNIRIGFHLMIVSLKRKYN